MKLCLSLISQTQIMKHHHNSNAQGTTIRYYLHLTSLVMSAQINLVAVG